MRIVDSPGVVFDDEDDKAGNILLRNVVKVEDVSDPIAVGKSFFLAIRNCAYLTSRGDTGKNACTDTTKTI
jgi:ribosome biogenesis GTPase A